MKQAAVFACFALLSGCSQPQPTAQSPARKEPEYYRVDPTTAGAKPPDGRKVQGTIHWVSARHALDAEVRLYDRLFTIANPGKPDEGKTYLDYLNPASMQVLTHCKLERSLAGAIPGATYQFERKGFFCVDLDSTPAKPVFNQTIGLRDTWAKINK